MKKRKWERLDEKGLRNVGGSNAKLKRAYGVEGQSWPRLVIGIYSSPFGFKLSCSEKEGPGAWWGEVPVPKELKAEVIDMLNEVEL